MASSRSKRCGVATPLLHCSVTLHHRKRPAASPQRPAASPQRLAASPQRHAASPQRSREQQVVVVRAPTVPGQLVLTCPPSRALALSAERSKHTATTSHREGRCSPCRSSSLLGSPGIPPCTLGDLGTQPSRPARVMAHCHASCDIVIMVSAPLQLVALARRLTRW